MVRLAGALGAILLVLASVAILAAILLRHGGLGEVGLAYGCAGSIVRIAVRAIRLG